MVGASQEQYKRQYFSATRKDLIDPSLGVIDGAIGESSSTGNITEWAMRSYFGRLNLGWDDKYLFEANLRADGSSRFWLITGGGISRLFLQHGVSLKKNS